MMCNIKDCVVKFVFVELNYDERVHAARSLHGVTASF